MKVKLILALLLFETLAWAKPTGTLSHVKTTWNGFSRIYFTYVPRTLAPKPSMVLYLNSTSSSKSLPFYDYYPWEELSDQYGFVMVWPISTWDTKDNTWHWECDGCESGFPKLPDDSGFLRSLIQSLQAQYGVTPGQTFVTGMSSGAYMTQRVGMEQSDIIAAIAPVAGAQYIQPLGTNFIPPVVPNPVSVYRLNGDEDPVVPYCGGVKGFWSNVRAYSPSMDQDADFWSEANANSCSTLSQSQPMCTNGQPTPGVNGQDATGCNGGAEVVFVREVGVGHTWVRGTESLVWAFFQKHGR
jgi:polyhydroxybutyrate depolymerase